MTICVPSIWIIAVLEFVAFLLLIKEYRNKKKAIALCMSFTTFGLIIDALAIVLGASLPIKIMYVLSRIRFVAHGMLIPLLFPICGYALNTKKKLMVTIWVLTIVAMLAGIMEGFAIDLQPITISGVTRMISGSNTPGWVNVIINVFSFGTVIPLIICGIIAWIKQKNAYLFFAGFFMFCFSALGPATGNMDLIFFISMIGEVLMVGFFWLFVKKKY